jgi:cell division protease FtsH
MVTIYGMSDKVGQVSYNDPTGEYGYQRPYSETTAEMIDKEVRSMIDSAYQRTIQLLTEKKAQVETIALELLSKEIIFKTDIERLIGNRPFEESEVAQQVAELNQHRSISETTQTNAQSTTETAVISPTNNEENSVNPNQEDYEVDTNDFNDNSSESTQSSDSLNNISTPSDTEKKDEE